MMLGELLWEIGNNLSAWEEHVAAVIEYPPLLAMHEAELDMAFNTARGYIDLIEEVMEAYRQDAVREEKEAASDIGLGMYIGLGVEWIVLIALGLWVIRRVGGAIERVRLRTKRVSEGYLDLPDTTRYGKDEMGAIQKDVDDMIVRMRDLIGEISRGSQAVSAATNELATSANETASASSHVAENIQEVTGLVELQAKITSETGKAIEEMTIGVQRIAENTGTISIHAGETNAQAQQGNELLLKLKAQMDVMVDEISRLEQTIAVLNEKSSEIGAITGNIRAFADQTGILSLNASIEAARAGEHGRGFAVVADEIRKLASASLESAKSISHLVSDTQLEIGNAGEHMKATIGQVDRSTLLLKEVEEGFRAISESIRHVSEQIHETSAVTEQMSASSEEVSASMDEAASSIREVSGKAENVAAATEEQLALVENIARSAEQLRGVVGNLNRAVGFFKI